MSNTTQNHMTTAEELGALRKELEDEGFPADAAQDIVMAFVREMADSGFVVKAKSGASA